MFYAFVIKYILLRKLFKGVKLVNIIKIFAIVLFTLFFNGCDDSNYIYDSNYTDMTQTDKISGIVVDGYISGSNVWIDLDNDGFKSSYESSSTTNSDGIFVFNNPTIVENSFISMYATSGIDTSTERDFTEVFRTILNTSILDSDTVYVISPITDLVAIWYEYSEGNSSSDLVDAKYKIANIFETTSSKVEENPMNDIELFAISQNLQHVKLLLKYILMNNMGELNEEEEKTLEKNIKIELIKRGMDLEDVLLDFELMHSCSEPNPNDPFCLLEGIPDNQKEFLIAQATELKSTIDSLSSDTSLNIENLNRLQKAIDTEMQKAYVMLSNSDSTTIFEVIDIDITNDSITRTTFSTVNAINDENGCISDGYNKLSNFNYPWPGVEPDTSSDLDNGISLRALGVYEEGVAKYEVTIFYPDLENATSGNKSTKIEENYSFGYDKAWLENSDKTIYVMTPKDEDGVYSCYRYQLSSTSDSEVVSTKVFRYSEL